MRIKKIIIFVFCAVLLMGTVAYGMMRPKQVPVIVVEPKDIKLFFTEEGFVKDENIINVFSLHPGEVLSLSVQKNQRVNQGEIICVIDNSRLVHELETAVSAIKGYESQISDLSLREQQMRDELTMSRNKLLGDYESLTAEENNASQAYLNATASREERITLQELIIEQNRIDLQVAQDDYATSVLLYENGVLTKSELDNRKAAADSLESLLHQSLQQLEIIRNSSETLSREDYFHSMKKSIQAQISGIDRQLQHSYNAAMHQYYITQIEGVEATIRLLEKQIEECIIKSPVTGTIVELNIDKSNVAAVNTPVAVISTGSDFLVEVYVPTSEIGKVKMHDIVDLELKSSAGVVYQGMVTDMEDKAVVTVSSLGIEKRKVKVTIEPMPEYANYFKAGFDLSASFTTYQENAVLTVPRTAVVKTDGSYVVWVIVNGRAELRTVEIEQELKVEYVIKSGLSEGDAVVKDANTPGLVEGIALVGNPM